jgi:TPR repeat protein
MFNKYRDFTFSLLLSCFLVPSSYAGKTRVEENEKEKESLSITRSSDKDHTDDELSLRTDLPIEIFAYVTSILAEEKTQKATKALHALSLTSKTNKILVDQEVRKTLNRLEKDVKESEDYPEDCLLSLYFHLNQASLLSPNKFIPHYIAAMKLGEGFGSHIATSKFFRLLYRRGHYLEDYLTEVDADIAIQNLTLHMNYLLTKWNKEKHEGKKKENNNVLNASAEKQLFKFYFMSKWTFKSPEFQQIYSAFTFAKRQLSDSFRNASASTLWSFYECSRWNNLCSLTDNNFQSILESCAQKGHPKAQYGLALRYANGDGVDLDLGKAFELFKQAADQGHAEAQCNLGSMFLRGGCVDRNLAEAVNLFRKAADQGSANARFNLSWMLERGEGVDQNLVEAVNLLGKAADQGHTEAQFKLGNMLRIGENVDQNLAKAVNLFSEAAAAGHAESRSYIAQIADEGHADAQYEMGMVYFEGHWEVDQDIEKAVGFFKLAADQGHAEAQFCLARMYFMGEGVAQDMEKAAGLFKLAADQGDGFARNYLGGMYEKGYGVPQDLGRAVEEYQKESECGNPVATLNLAYCIRMGLGVTADPDRADKLEKRVDDPFSIEIWKEYREVLEGILQKIKD